MIFAIFIARETRHLRVRYVNDSKFVHLSIYNATVFCIILGPLATLVVRDKANSNFAFVAGPGRLLSCSSSTVNISVLVCTYATLGMIFVPKMKYIHRVPPSADEVEKIPSYLVTFRSSYTQMETVPLGDYRLLNRNATIS